MHMIINRLIIYLTLLSGRKSLHSTSGLYSWLQLALWNTQYMILICNMLHWKGWYIHTTAFAASPWQQNVSEGSSYESHLF